MRTPVILLLSLSFVVSSCQEDVLPGEEYVFSNPSFKLDGVYDVIDLSSAVPVDLNRDGEFSQDILMETGQWKNSASFHVEYDTESPPGQPNLFYQRLFVWVPYTNLFADLAGNYLYSDFGRTNLLAKCWYLESKSSIEIANGSHGQGEVVSARILSEGILSVQIQQTYYTTKGWERLEITGTYKKRI